MKTFRSNFRWVVSDNLMFVWGQKDNQDNRCPIQSQGTSRYEVT